MSIWTNKFPAFSGGFCFAGGISGLVGLAKGFGHIWPYSLMAYGMNSNSPQQMNANGYLGFVVICIVYIAVISAVGAILLGIRESN